MVSQRAAVIVCAAGLLLLSGCGPTFSERAANGITFFCPGVGNTDFAYFNVRKGLEAAGYQGEVSAFIWTLTLTPLDQKLGPIARLRSAALADIIDEYIERYPGRPVNLIGLSAGTGIAMWAVEDLRPGHMVDNVVLLSSSLSHDYDVSRALEHMRGKIYVYYSPYDSILTGPMKLFGTIDGKIGVDGAGAVGLTSRRHADRIVNVPWKPAYKRYGYAGAHLDSTNAEFVREVVAAHVMESPDRPGRGEGVATARGEAPADDAARRSRTP